MKTAVVLFVLFFLFCPAAFGQSVEERLKALEQMLKKQEQTINEQQKIIEALKVEVSKLKSPEPPAVEPAKKPASTAEAPTASPEVVAKEAETPPPRKDLLSYQVGGANLRLIDLSLDALVVAGTSTATDPQLLILEGGGHNPSKRGFNIPNVELSIAGAVDPYFNAEAHIVYYIDPVTSESVVELEEAFFTTQKLPFDLQLKGGLYLTEFGVINAQHPHQWDWLDQPVIINRLFGPDGMRAAGARLAWLAPLPWYSQLIFGMQNASGEPMASYLADEEFYEERPVAGRPFVARSVKTWEDFVYSSRWENSWDLSDETTVKQGFSGAYGPNASGPDGQTWIYGADVKLKWRPENHFRGWPFLLFQSEIMGRSYVADSFSMSASDTAGTIYLPRQTIRDWGFYAQLLWGFRKDWATGIRYDYASGSGSSVDVDVSSGTVVPVDRKLDPWRGDRHRISPILAWHPSEFSRFRLQFNYDRADWLPHGNAYTIWLGGELMLGAHAAHKF